MTVAPQPATSPLGLDPVAAGASPGLPATDMFGGLIAALAVPAVQPSAGTAPVTLPGELPGTPAAPAIEAEPAAAAADQLLALSSALPARAQLAVKQPGKAVESRAPKDAEGDDADQTDAPSELQSSAAGPLTVTSVMTTVQATLAPAQAGPAPTRSSVSAGNPVKARLELAPEKGGQASMPTLSVADAPAAAAAKPSIAAIEIGRPQQAAEQTHATIRAVLAQVLPTTQRAKPLGGGELKPLGPELKPTAHLAAFTPLPFLAAEMAARSDAPAPTQLPIEPETGELIIERQLDMAAGDEWLDDLARDIARTATDGAPLKFRLNPENLGSLRVEIAADRGGTAVRLTADTEAARAIIADAQPRLITEARAQGLRISEAHVDLGHQPGSGDGRRPADDLHEPQLRTARSLQDEEPDDGKPTRRSSERYA